MAVAFTFATIPAKAGSHAVEACLITKTDINPFFVKMKEGAEARANELGVKLSFFAGKVDGDHETQVRAVETCIASGAKGILIAASDTKAIVPVLKNALKKAKLKYFVEQPKGALHGYMFAERTPHHPRLADAGWKRLLDLFDRNLKKRSKKKK